MEIIQSSNNKQTVIVVKQKSKRTAVSLALLFGPFGLLYTSFFAFFMMLIVVPLVLISLIALSGSIFSSSMLGGLIVFLIITLLLYNVICAIVAYIVCKKINNKRLLKIQDNSSIGVQSNVHEKNITPTSSTKKEMDLEHEIIEKTKSVVHNSQNKEERASSENSFINLISYLLMLLFVFCLLYMFYDLLIN